MIKYSTATNKCFVHEDDTLKAGLTAISASGLTVACVVDSNNFLKGILSDSDVRKALLKGAVLDDRVSQWMNSTPLAVSNQLTEHELTAVAIESGKREIPLLDDQNRVVDVFVLGKLPASGHLHNSKAETLESYVSKGASAFVLAGGLGTRLRSIVNDRPKPLAEVGGKPILDTLLSEAYSHGIRKFYISVNYMAEKIEEHLARPEFRDFEFVFVREKSKLGTAGSIGEIAHQITEPLLVFNADVLTKTPFASLYKYHDSHDADITCVVRPFPVEIPFGVVETEGECVISIREKPRYQYMVNAGIYVLSPNVCQMIRPQTHLDMPELIQQALDLGKKIVPFPLHEYWVDIGQPDDYKKANQDYSGIFNS